MQVMQSPDQSPNRKTILIIEDDANTSALIALYLEREGFRAETAEDGQAGLDLAKQLRPDLVVLDLMLPKIDGWEVCRRLQQNEEVPVIMLTARGEEIDRVVDVHIDKLRQKIEPNPGQPIHILTVRGVGYQFNDAPFKKENIEY